MRFSKIAITLFVAVISASSVSYSSDSIVDFSKWSKSDLHQFLSDFQVDFDPSDNRNGLITKAKAQWNSFTKPYYTWSVDELTAYLDRKKVQYKVNSKAADAHDQLVDLVSQIYPSDLSFTVEEAKKSGKAAAKSASESASSAYDKVSNWIFDTWSTSQLADFVKDAKDKSIKSVATTRKDLLKQAQLIYDRNVESNSNFGQNYFPGKWIYDSWSDQSLRSWIQRNRIDLKAQGIDAKQKTLKALDHDKLVSTVCKNARNVYDGIQDSRNSLLDQIQIAGAEIYDKSGNVKDSIFQSWSNSQLNDWLSSHNLVDTTQKSVPSKKELFNIAKENSYLLQQDINRYLATAKKKTSPILSKASDAGNDLVDSTFNLWDHSKLESLVARLKKNIPSWLDDRADEASKTAFSVSKSVSKAANSASKDAQNAQHQASSFLSHIFDFWSVSELSSWLEAQGHNINNIASDTTKKASKSAVQKRNDLAKTASDYLSSANEFSQAKFDVLVNSLAKAWTSISSTAFESWSDSDLRDWIKHNTPDSKELYYGAKDTHDELVKTARKVFKRVQKDGQTVAKQAQQAAADGSSYVSSAYGEASSVVEDAAASAASAASEAYGEASSVVEDAAASGASAASEVYGEASSVVEDAAASGASAASGAQAKASSSRKNLKKSFDEKVYGKPISSSFTDSANEAVKYLRKNVEDVWAWASDQFSRFAPGNTEL